MYFEIGFKYLLTGVLEKSVISIMGAVKVCFFLNLQRGSCASVSIPNRLVLNKVNKSV
jgi:hypothetical protein